MAIKFSYGEQMTFFVLKWEGDEEIHIKELSGKWTSEEVHTSHSFDIDYFVTDDGRRIEEPPRSCCFMTKEEAFADASNRAQERMEKLLSEIGILQEKIATGVAIVSKVKGEG